MKVKVLRFKETKEFAKSFELGGKVFLGTCETPDLMRGDATEEDVISYYNHNLPHVDMSYLEVVEYDLVESNSILDKEIHDKLLLLNSILSLYYQRQRTVGWFDKRVIGSHLDQVIITAQQDAIINQKEIEKKLDIL